MTDVPGQQLNEEPQEERGAPGSRGEGSEEPGSGHRPSGTSDADNSTSIDPQEPDTDSPTLQTP
jgi:hypothetical protein